ncbi:hypothetical protein Tco_1318921 [Tanacetum coccineum]
MRTRSSLEYTIPRRRNRRRSRQQQEAIPIVDKFPIQMADDRPMAEQLQAPTGGYDGPLPPMPPPYVNPDNEDGKETEVTKDQVQPTSSQSTARVQPPVVQIKEKVEMDMNRERDVILEFNVRRIFRDFTLSLALRMLLSTCPNLP